ncbi:hypothetical protein M406DRAFT_57161, partial [Cryphonectria parasitica EP155]
MLRMLTIGDPDLSDDVRPSSPLAVKPICLPSKSVSTGPPNTAVSIYPNGHSQVVSPSGPSMREWGEGESENKKTKKG